MPSAVAIMSGTSRVVVQKPFECMAASYKHHFEERYLLNSRYLAQKSYVCVKASTDYLE